MINHKASFLWGWIIVVTSCTCLLLYWQLSKHGWFLRYQADFSQAITVKYQAQFYRQGIKELHSDLDGSHTLFVTLVGQAQSVAISQSAYRFTIRHEQGELRFYSDQLHQELDGIYFRDIGLLIARSLKKLRYVDS